MYVQPRSNGLHVSCGECRGMMRPEIGRQLGDRTQWLWYRCLFDRNHITRAIPLPVRMARG
jgi:hypothetical protein